MRERVTKSGLIAVEGRNARRERMRAWRTQHDPQARRLERELKQLDARIEVDFVEPAVANVPLEERAPGLLPGRWHIIIKTEPGFDDHYFPITGPNMSYRDPELAIVEEMKARDLWHAGIFDRMLAEWDKEAARLTRQEITDGEARIEQVAAAYRAAKRVPGDGGLHRRHDKKGKPEHERNTYGSRHQTSRGGVVLPAGVEA